MLNPLRIRELRRSVTLAAPLERVFDFFSRAENLDAVTPHWLRFRILTSPPIRMAEGTSIEYMLRLGGIPIRWTTAISLWNPPFGFVDRQVRGPYAFWEHKHAFEEVEGSTRMEDHVRFAVPGFVFEPVIHNLFVGPRLRRIFDFREAKLRDIFR